MSDQVRVLLIEDSPVDAMILRRHVEQSSEWKVFGPCGSIADAEDRIEDEAPETFELVLVDLTLPDASGLESVEIMRSLLPDAAVVVVTAEDQLEVALQAMEKGASEYLVKGEMTPRGVQRALFYALNSKRLLVQAEAAEANVRLTLAKSPYAVLVVDRVGAVLFSNRAAKPLLPGLTDDSGARLATTVRADEEINMTVRVHDTPTPITMIVRAMVWASTPVRVIYIEDLSAQSEAEELRGMLDQAGVSPEQAFHWHEIKHAGLRGIQRCDDRIGHDTPEDDLTEILQTKAAWEHVLGIANTYMVKGETPEQHLDVVAIVQSCARNLRPTIERHARLRLRATPVPDVVADRLNLTLVFNNLIENAAEAMRGPADGNEITVETRVQDGYVRVSVADTGSGIDPALSIDDLIDRGTTKAKGSGIGLRTTKDTIEKWGGRLDFQSTPGVGTEFFVLLPIPPEPEDAANLRVLVLEDEPNYADAYRRFLDGDNDLHLFDRAEDALEHLLHDRAFDAVLMDLHLAGAMTGLDFYRRVLGIDPELAKRTAFSTGGADDDQTETGMENTLHPRMAKPFKRSDLMAMLEALRPQ
jgi:signal transduction histidine kinase